MHRRIIFPIQRFARNKFLFPRLIILGSLISVFAMTPSRLAENQTDEPVTLHRTIQTMIGTGLRHRYKPPKKLSHELFVLLLQLKEQERREAAANGGASRS
jgi:hypothetical protein